jgi:uncharacterized protein with GYD domain
MPRFLIVVNYSPEGSRAIKSSGGSARKAAIEKTIADLGGRLETFDFAFGSDDSYSIVDLPDHESAAALTLTVGARGAAHARTIVLLTPEQLDRAAGKEPEYAPPGQTG